MTGASKVRLAIAAFAVAVLGCETGTTFVYPADAHPPDDHPGGDVVVQGAGVTGRWAMFEWEDPVAVEIRQSGGAISGNGCCAGLGENQTLSCCGDVSGSIVERQASFGFSFDYGGEPYVYATDVFVSADEQRMTGTFTRTGSHVAWVRIGPSESYLPDVNPALETLLDERRGEYALMLAGGYPVLGGDFSGQTSYRFFVDRQFVRGDLGPFWTGEMSWSDSEQTLAVGPVPATEPSLPIALSLQFFGTRLASVDATMASGLRYHFAAMASQL